MRRGWSVRVWGRHGASAGLFVFLGALGGGCGDGETEQRSALGFGTECTKNADCGRGFICLSSDDDEFFGGGPAGGYCTRRCTFASECDAVFPGAYCAVVDPDVGQNQFPGVCLQPCELSDSDELRCHGRQDLTCDPRGLGAGALCFPDCRRDVDCGEGYCDERLGVCVPEPIEYTPFGDACEADGDCPSGLFCLSQDSDDFQGGGPAGGYCTLRCRYSSECAELYPNARCEVVRDEDPSGVCLQPCVSNARTLATCHGRTDLSCVEPLAATTASLCFPTCGSHDECGERFCDLLVGVCVDEEPQGLGTGAPCDANDRSQTQCKGVCWQSGGGEEGEGICTGFCTLGTVGCNSDEENLEPGDGACLFAPQPTGQGVQDLGFCGQVCECDDDCSAPESRCVEFPDEELGRLFGVPGYCSTVSDDGISCSG